MKQAKIPRMIKRRKIMTACRNCRTPVKVWRKLYQGIYTDAELDCLIGCRDLMVVTVRCEQCQEEFGTILPRRKSGR